MNVTEDLIEKLSEEVHKAWMKEMLEQCRTCGKYLRAYSELPERVKEKRRKSVRDVINALVSIDEKDGGIRIEHRPGFLQLGENDLETVPGVYIRCGTLCSLREFITLLYEKEILADEYICLMNVPENIKDVLIREKHD